MNLILWALVGLAMAGLVAWRKAARGRPGLVWVDAVFGGAGACLGGVAASAAAAGAPAQGWPALLGAAVGAALLLGVASLHWLRDGRRR